MLGFYVARSYPRSLLLCGRKQFNYTRNPHSRARVFPLHSLELERVSARLSVVVKHGDLNTKRFHATVALRHEDCILVGATGHLSQDCVPPIIHLLHRRLQGSPRRGVVVVIVERGDDWFQLFRVTGSCVAARSCGGVHSVGCATGVGGKHSSPVGFACVRAFARKSYIGARVSAARRLATIEIRQRGAVNQLGERESVHRAQ